MIQVSRQIIAGAWHQVGGWLSVLVGTLVRDDVACALGHRQQLVGTLQRLCREDRASVEARVDRWLTRHYGPLFGQTPARRYASGDPTSPHGELNP